MSAPKLAQHSLKWNFQDSIQTRLPELSQINTYKQLYAIAFDWLTVIATIAVCETYFSWPLYCVTLFVIASRQHALLVIMHEAAHFRIAKNRTLNDLIGNYFSAFPILAATEWYRDHHNKHHKFLNTDKDPDWNRKITLEEWQFPQPRNQLAKTILRQFLLGGYEWITLMINMSGLFPLGRLTNMRRLLTLAHKVSYYAIIISAIYSFGMGPLFLTYWLAPLLIVFPALQRIRSISEHFGLQHTHKLNDSRNILANWLELGLFAPHNINYHLVHHMYPSVPQHNLKKLQSELLSFSDYQEHAHQNDSYILASPNSVLNDIIIKTTNQNKFSNTIGGKNERT